MKKELGDGWLYDDWDGQFTPECRGPKGEFIYIGADYEWIEIDDGCVAVWAPMKVVAEYLRMLGWTVTEPSTRR